MRRGLSLGLREIRVAPSANSAAQTFWFRAAVNVQYGPVPEGSERMIRTMTIAAVLKLKQLDDWQRFALKMANPNDVARVEVTAAKVTFLDDVKE